MSSSLSPPARRRLCAALAVGSLALLPLLGSGPSAGAATPAKPHWGLYQWSGGTEKANVRAYWLFDRTGDQRMHDIIQVVANAWNGARNDHPELPYIGVFRDDANAGKCFVNQTPGYSVATGCLLPPDFSWATAIEARNPDAQGHLLGAAFAVGSNLTDNQAFTVVCHVIGYVMGLDNSTDPASCMSTDFHGDTFKWYSQADADAVLALYNHSDATTSTTSSSTTSSTTVASTTTSSSSTSTTSTSTTSSTTSSSTSTTSTSITLPVTTTSITLP